MLVAIIPARKNSIRIKKKNIKSFFGKTMLTRAIDLVKKTKIFDQENLNTRVEISIGNLVGGKSIKTDFPSPKFSSTKIF